MNLYHKLKTALTIYRERGLPGILKIIKSKLAKPDAAFRPDETKIAYDVLDADHIAGLMIDVGAHHGSSLAPFAARGWQVYAFEPDSENRRALEENFSSFPNVHIDPRAVSSHNQDNVAFYRSKESSGISGLSAFHPSHTISEPVNLVTLESFLKEKYNQQPIIDFLKIDTEGHDFFVLKGLAWDEKPPRLIVCEFEDGKTIPLGYTFHDLARFLLEKGYKIVVSEWYPIKEYGQIHRWRQFARYPCQLTEPKSWGNIIAVHEQPMFEHLLKQCGL